MALLNNASLPSPMWATVRLMASLKSPATPEQLTSLLSPPTLHPGEDGKTVDEALKTLSEMELVIDDGAKLRLSAALKPPLDFQSFSDQLRKVVLDPNRNVGIGQDKAQTQSRDMVRALAWFLTRDPYGDAFMWKDGDEQAGVFPGPLGDPFANMTRWNKFFYWAPALGFAATPILSGDTKNSSQALIPDCTLAVKRAILSLWTQKTHLDAATAIAALVEALPVLPGGRYSRELGLEDSGTQRIAPSLSFALLSASDQGWIALDARSDAIHEVILLDPDRANGLRRVTDITMIGDLT